MSFLHKIAQLVEERHSHLCVGLDPQSEQLPQHISADRPGVGEFLAEIIRVTAPYACAYKPNLAFFGGLGAWGIDLLREIIEEAQRHAPVILDAKFGDIGNTAQNYARFAFETMRADAVTLNPFLGKDSLIPFLEYEDRFAFVLGITSNPGSADLQKQILAGGDPVYLALARSLHQALPQPNWGWVAGATQPTELTALHAVAPERWLLVPGVGAQGGDARQALESSLGNNGQPVALINVSRGIMYAGNDEQYIEAVREAAKSFHARIQITPTD